MPEREQISHESERPKPADGDESNEHTGDESILQPIERVLYEVWNWGLIEDANEDIKKTDWFHVAVTTFNLGIIGLIVWSVYMVIAFVVTYLISSTGLVSAITRISTIGPFAPVILFVFAVASRRAVQRLQQASQSPKKANLRNLPLFLISFIALLAAASARFVTFQTTVRLYGTTLSQANVVSVMIVDGLYISLLLIGLGGLASLILISPEERTPE